MKTYLYKLYSSTDDLLYVGIAGNIDQRLSNHKAVKTWWTEVDHIELRLFDFREQADQAETECIRTDHPKYNEVLKPPYKIEKLEAVLRPKSHAKLPAEEIAYLSTLTSDQTYQRCAELQRAGWSVPAMLEGAKVAPTATQLRTELKYIRNPNTGVPVPLPPVNPKEAARRREAAKKNQLSSDEKAQLKSLAEVAKLRRGQHNPGHPIYDTTEDYNRMISELYARGVLLSEIAEAAGVTETNVRRRVNL